MEAGFEVLQGRAAARHRADQIGDAVALGIRAPDGVLIQARHLPGHLVAGRRLFSPNRCPSAKLTRRDVRTEIFERGTGPAAVLKIKVVAELDQVGHAMRLDHNRRAAGRIGHL